MKKISQSMNKTSTMHKNRLSHADLRATTASDARNWRFLLFTDSELDVARYDCAQIGLPPCPHAFSACFEHHSYALLRKTVHPLASRGSFPWLGLLLLGLLLGMSQVSCDDSSSQPEDEDIQEEDLDPAEVSGDLVDVEDGHDKDTGDALDQPSAPEVILADQSEEQLADSPPTEPLSLSAIEPAEGPVQGATEVVLSGAGFDSSTEVYFGAVRAPMVELIDSHALQVQTPSHEAGVVDLKVVNASSRVVLEAAFRFVSGVSITGVTPQRVPAFGGAPLEVQGSGFDTDAALSLGGRSAIEVVRQSDTSLTALSPPLPVGVHDLRVSTAAGSVLMPGALEAYALPEVEFLFPSAGPSAGGTAVDLFGAGLEQVTQALLCGQESQILDQGPEQLIVRTPAHTPGHCDLVLQSADGSVLVASAFRYFTNDSELTLQGISPGRGSSAGGEKLVLQGTGFGPGMTMTIDGEVVAIEAFSANALWAYSLAHAPGEVVVGLSRGGESHSLEFEYLPALELSSLSPPSGPVEGGTEVELEGSGFGADMEIYFGPLPAELVTFEDSNSVVVKAPPGSGRVDLRIERDGLSAVLEDAFSYQDELSVFGLTPSRGAQAGGTLVTVFGRGFESDAVVLIDGVPALEQHWLDSNTLSARTPFHLPAVVAVEVEQGEESAASPQWFTYFDPSSSYGGAWGDPIAGALNITVLEDASGEPLPEALVMLNYDNSTELQGLTNGEGQITFSAPELVGSQTVSASKLGYSSISVNDIDSENLTIFLEKHEAEEGDPPEQSEPSAIYGSVTGAEKITLESTPNKSRYITVVTTQTHPFSGNPSPGEEGQLDGNGEYRINTRIGEMAVVAYCGLIDDVTGEFEARYMGLERFVFVSEGSEQRIDLNCDIPLTQRADFKLIGAPLDEGATDIRLYPFLFMGAEGYLGGVVNGLSATEQVSITGLVPLEGDFAAMSYYVWGGAFTNGSLPYSLLLEEEITDFSELIELEPLLGLPRIETPQASGTLFNRHIEWTMSTPEMVDFYALRIIEPGLVSKTIWEVYLPGETTSVDLPEFLPDAGGADPYSGYSYLQLTAYKLARPFSFDQFSFLDTRLRYRKAWSYVSLSFNM